MRQQDRRHCFVSSLVVFATGLIAAIWPLSAPVLHDTNYPHNVLPLQDFITETLRRSKTSYSTLQVAMFYVVLLKDCLPKCDFTREQSSVPAEKRPMQCGRRMFLAALMLASKFLQDRSYSTRAWGKITGLPAAEINLNELKFLQAVGWNLHVSKDKFERWSHTVIALSGPPKPGVSPLSRSSLVEMLGWKEVLGRLTTDCRDDFSIIGNAPALTRNPCSVVDAHGMLTPPSSPPESIAGDQVEPPGRAVVKAVSFGSEKPADNPVSYPAAPPPPSAPYQRNLPTPRGTPGIAQGSMSLNLTTQFPPRCQESSSAMSMLKVCPAATNRAFCPPPRQRPCRMPNTVEQSSMHRRPSISSFGSVQSSPESVRSDMSAVHGRSRSSSISSLASSAATSVSSSTLTDAAQLAAIRKATAVVPPVSLKRECSSRLRSEEYDAADTLLRFHVAPEESNDQAGEEKFCTDVAEHDTLCSWEQSSQPVAPLPRMTQRSTKKRTHSKSASLEVLGEGCNKLQSMVRRDLLSNHDILSKMSTSEEVSQGAFAARACKRTRSSKEKSTAVDVARVLLQDPWQGKSLPSGRYRSNAGQQITSESLHYQFPHQLRTNAYEVVS